MPMKHNGLAKLAEELGELGQVVGKKLAYPDGPHPDEHREKPLNARLEDEIADVQAAMTFVLNELGLNAARVQLRAFQKLKLFEQWGREE